MDKINPRGRSNVSEFHFVGTFVVRLRIVLVLGPPVPWHDSGHTLRARECNIDKCGPTDFVNFCKKSKPLMKRKFEIDEKIAEKGGVTGEGGVTAVAQVDICKCSQFIRAKFNVTNFTCGDPGQRFDTNFLHWPHGSKHVLDFVYYLKGIVGELVYDSLCELVKTNAVAINTCGWGDRHDTLLIEKFKDLSVTYEVLPSDYNVRDTRYGNCTLERPHNMFSIYRQYLYASPVKTAPVLFVDSRTGRDRSFCTITPDPEGVFRRRILSKEVCQATVCLMSEIGSVIATYLI